MNRAEIRAAMAEARERTWRLVEPLSDDLLTQAACDYLSPPVWDLGHIGNFEERWLVQELAGRPELRTGYNDTYNAFEHPRPERPKLDLLDRQGCRQYQAEVREQALAVLDEVEEKGRLLRDGFVYWMLVLHESQHQETLLQSIQMRGAEGHDVLAKVRRLPEPGPVGDPWCDVPAGRFTMGRPHASKTYDNEADAHEVELASFQMARYPVTVGEYLRFLDEGGYDDRSLWSERGLRWLDEEPHHAPLYWRETDDGWMRHGPGCVAPIADWPDVTLSHVTYFEAEAYAAWTGARLPSEAEWERAAQGTPAAAVARANVEQDAFSPSRIGAYPAGASDVGCQHMLGDVWEWTSSGFEPYPGFEAFPYDQYSKVFFGGDYQVLRGGSWATRATCATITFRNWDHPYRRQIFSGVRLARE